MTNPQFPPRTPEQYPPTGQSAPGAVPPQAAWQPPGQPGQPSSPQPPATKRGNVLTSKPVIGIAALVVGLVVGASAAGGGKATNGSAAAAPTVTVTAIATADGQPTNSAEPSEQPSDDASAPADTSYKYGQTVGFLYEDVEISVKIEAPKTSTNMFDKDNLEARTTVCNKGTETIDEMSAQGLGLYAEDKSGGEYDLIGAYRRPEFPVYDYDSAKLKAGKCRTGWISFEDAKKAVRIATEVSDTTYSWSKSGS